MWLPRTPVIFLRARAKIHIRAIREITRRLACHVAQHAGELDYLAIPPEFDQAEELISPFVVAQVRQQPIHGSLLIDLAYACFSDKGSGETSLLRKLKDSLKRCEIFFADSYYCTYWLIVDVYDAYARSPSRATIHLDVLVPNGTMAESAFEFAVQWLEKVGLGDAELTRSRCNFCHSENAGPRVVSDIERDGYHVFRMEGCPKT